MKRLIIGLFLSIPVVGFAQTGEKNFIDQNYIEVTGKAELEIIPDLIYLKIALSDRDNKDKQPLPEIEKKMIATLSEIGINVNKDLSLMDFASDLKSYWLKSNVSLTKQYQLVVHDTKTLQSIFVEFQKLGISNVSIVKLDHSKMEQYRKDVKVSAIKAAKEKAELLAVALNQSIGKALYIQEVDPPLQRGMYSAPSNFVMRGSLSNSAVNTTSTEIEFEKINVESTILVRFILR